MPEQARAIAESRELRQRLETLEETYRATLNILDDFDEEKHKLAELQQATMNLLEDVDDERSRFQAVQRATLNLMEDMVAERERAEEMRRALMNILDDVEAERTRAESARLLLEAANRELEAFSYSVSHDLRAPLRAVSGFAQAVVEDYNEQIDDEGRRRLRLIQDNAHKMGQLIDDLLAFSRLGRQPMNYVEINMAEMARTVFQELMALSPTRSVDFRVLPVPFAYGDKPMIRQVLVNLIANAIKFTRNRDRAMITFGFDVAPPWGAFYISDNGVGFDMQYVDKLFGVFQRLHSATEFEGTGVGLALAYRIVARHGGRIWAQGDVDQGATFFFSLPQHQEADSPRSKTSGIAANGHA